MFGEDTRGQRAQGDHAVRAQGDHAQGDHAPRNVLSQLLIPQRKIATVQVTICPIDFDYGYISF